MLLKVNGCELEIVEDKFVCFATHYGETSHFCEWKSLDPALLEKFKAMRLELMEFMQNFTLSDTKATFESIAEEFSEDRQIFNDDGLACSVPPSPKAKAPGD